MDAWQKLEFTDWCERASCVMHQRDASSHYQRRGKERQDVRRVSIRPNFTGCRSQRRCRMHDVRLSFFKFETEEFCVFGVNLPVRRRFCQTRDRELTCRTEEPPVLHCFILFSFSDTTKRKSCEEWLFLSFCPCWWQKLCKPFNIANITGSFCHLLRLPPLLTFCATRVLANVPPCNDDWWQRWVRPQCSDSWGGNLLENTKQQPMMRGVRVSVHLPVGCRRMCLNSHKHPGGL